MENMAQTESELDELVEKTMSELHGEILTTTEILGRVYGYYMADSNYRAYRPLLASLKRLEQRGVIKGRLFPTVGNIWTFYKR